MRSQPIVGFTIVVLLILQSFAVPTMACEMPSSQVSETVSVVSATESSSHEHHMMHDSAVSSHTTEMMHDMSMPGDCCGDNCQCPQGTGFSSALLGASLVDDVLLESEFVPASLFNARDAHRLSQFKPPIFA